MILESHNQSELLGVLGDLGEEALEVLDLGAVRLPLVRKLLPESTRIDAETLCLGMFSTGEFNSCNSCPA